MKNTSPENPAGPERRTRTVQPGSPTLIHYSRPRAASGKPTRRHTFAKVCLLVAGALILVNVVVPNLFDSRCSPCETGGIAGMKTISSAENQYHQRHHRYGTIEELSWLDLIDPALAASSSPGNPRNGYWVKVKVCGPGEPQGFFCVGFPTSRLWTDMYYVDDAGLIWEAPSSAPEPTTDAYGHSPGQDWQVIGS